MAVEEWSFWRHQNFVGLPLLIDGLDHNEKERKVKRERVVWIREWLQRRERGTYNQLIQEICQEDDREYAKYFCMPVHKFEDLLSQIQDCLTKEDTMMRPSTQASECLAGTLCFLASGETFSSLEKQFRISRTAISYIVIEVSDQKILTTHFHMTFVTFCIGKPLRLLSF